MRVRSRFTRSGDPTGVKVRAAVFEVVDAEVEIEALPADIPERIPRGGLAASRATQDVRR